MGEENRVSCAKVMQELFFELLQITLGNRDCFTKIPSSKEWGALYKLACKQSLESVLLDGVNKAKNFDSEIGINQSLVLEWIGVGLQTEARNKVQNERLKELCQLFRNGGYRCTILKGQGTALYYDHPEHRQCGDIDVWVEGSRDEVLSFLRQQRYKIWHVDIKHADVEIFEDVHVEVHFRPSWMYSPSTNKRLSRLFSSKVDSQFANQDSEAGFTHATIDFDLVYSMVHIYRHIFSEGIGLRQLVDYYYILQRSTEELRKEAYGILCSFRMKSFVGGVMWILCECFGMKKELALCPLNERHGIFLLSEIMTAGNFGHYDDRTRQISKDKKFKRGFVQLGRNLRFVSYYPSEVLWSPFWKLWHWCWRKRKGYL